MKARVMRVKSIGVDFVGSEEMGYSIIAKSLFHTVNIRLTFKEFNKLKLAIGDKIKVYYIYEPVTGEECFIGCKALDPKYKAIVIQ